MSMMPWQQAGRAAASRPPAGMLADVARRGAVRRLGLPDVSEALVEALPDPVLVLCEGRLAFLNGRMAQLLSVPERAAVVGLPAGAIIDAAAVPGLLEGLGESLETGEPFGYFEIVLIRRDGRPLVVRGSATPVAWRGRASSLLLARDITWRKELETDLRRRQEMLQRILDASPDGHIIHVEDEIVFANRAAAAMFRYASAEALIGRGVLEVFNPSDVGTILERRRQMRAERAVTPPVKTVLRRADGSEFDSECLAGPIDWQGMTAILINVRDVSERNRTAAALEESEQRLRSVTENLPGFLFQYTIGADRTVRFRSFGSRLLGRAGGPGEGEGGQPRTLFDLVDDDTRRALAASMLAAADGSDRWEQMVRIVERDGGVRWLRATAQARAPGEGPVVWDGIALDETERVHEARRNQQLEVELRQREKIESLGTLAGGIAHELNNLLQPIMTTTELVMRALGEGSPEHARLRRVVTASERAAEVVHRILTFSRLDAASCGPVELGAVLGEAIELLRSTLPTSITLEVEAAGAVGMVQGDRTQLAQILFNLAANARDAMEGRVGRIAVRVRRAGASAVLTVRDDGPGMDADTQKRIFEPFFTTKDVGKGTGLGLAIVHGIVQQHGGTIEVESAPGRGTTFAIRLPLAADGDGRAPPHRQAAPEESPPWHRS